MEGAESIRSASMVGVGQESWGPAQAVGSLGLCVVSQGA